MLEGGFLAYIPIDWKILSRQFALGVTSASKIETQKILWKMELVKMESLISNQLSLAHTNTHFSFSNIINYFYLHKEISCSHHFD